MSLTRLQTYLESDDIELRFLHGDACALLCQFLDNAFDCCLISLSHWKQRATHSNSAQVSGRAKELQQRGFYFLKYDPKGTNPGDTTTLADPGVVSSLRDKYADEG